jgi:hypothetical protein
MRCTGIECGPLRSRFIAKRRIEEATEALFELASDICSKRRRFPRLLVRVVITVGLG